MTAKRKLVLSIFVLAVSLSLASSPTSRAFADDDLKSRLETKLVPYIEQVMAAQEIPGLAIGVVLKGKIIFARGFGVKNLDTGEPITPESLFHMASISKTFVATAVMQLVEKGMVSLDDTIVKHIPYFKLADERYKKITVQQMLSHVSGMPDVEDYEWSDPQYDDGALELYVRSLADLELISGPGERFAYSNMAYEVLGDLIAKVSGKTFEAYVKENILDPLGMKESNFLRDAVSPKLTTSPHIRALITEVSSVYPYNRMHAPSSTLHSSAHEMCYWAIANLNRGVIGETRILKDASYDIMWKKWSDAFGGRSVGLSWFIVDYKGNPTIQHSGGDVGYSTNLVLLPEKGAAVVVLCNEIPGPVRPVTNAALDVILGLDPEMPKMQASVPVCRALKEEGIDAAVSLFKKIRREESGAYDLSMRQFFFIADGLIETGRTEQAAEVANLCIAVDSKDADGYRLLAFVHYMSGDIDSALDAVRQGLEIDPDDEELKEYFEQLTQMQAEKK